MFVSVFAFLYFRLNGQHVKILVGSVVIFFMLAAVASTIYYFRSYKKPKKELLCLQYSTAFQPLGLAGQLPVFLNLFFNGRKKDLFDTIAAHPVPYFIFVVAFVALLLLSFASLRTYKEIQENARKNYPLAFV